ncbi:MAG: polysaccharide biosynthesis protein, partial [Thermotogaceae bacterium]|nr:polysaccharide biosynthesis protein [Thermotogaceae bacterium]
MRKFLLFLIDIGLTLFAGVLALFIRFGFDFAEMSKYAPSVYIYVALAAIIYIINGNYRVVWAYASSRDMMLLFRGSIISYLVNLAFFYFYKSIVLPRSVGVLVFLGSGVLIMLSRIVWHWMAEYKKASFPSEKRAMIIGAGDAGVMLLEEFEKRPALGKVVAFLDDSRRKIGRKIRGVPVYGPITRAMEYVDKLKVNEVVIAIPSATKDEMKRILDSLDLKKISVKTLPGIYELTDGKARIGNLREISIEDLLGRDEVKVEIEEIADYL